MSTSARALHVSASITIAAHTPCHTNFQNPSGGAYLRIERRDVGNLVAEGCAGLKYDQPAAQLVLLHCYVKIAG